MSETRKLTTIVAADVAGYSRLTVADEERTVLRLRAQRGDLIDPAINAHHGRGVKRTGDGTLMEFRSVVDAVRCAIEVQNGMVERNAGLQPERQIRFRVGIHLGDVIEEEDGDLMGDGVNIAARLENICEPGAICGSEHAYLQVKSRLDFAVSDLGAKDLKNIPEPVHVYSLEVGKPVQAKPAVTVAPVVASPPTKKRSAPVPLLAGLAALLVIVAVALWFFLMRPGANLAANAPTHLSIVVLPFANLSNDPKQDYLADGITDNLITDLSRIRNSFVIARNTAFTYKGKNVDAKEIGKELGVRYVLEGSVQRDGNRVRVNAQLIDAESGSHLWADRFEEDLADLFKLQDDVVARLANTLGFEMVEAEAAKGIHSVNPDTLDLTMRGWSVMYHPPTKQNDAEALDIFQRALKIDSSNPDALAGSAYTDMRDATYGWTSSVSDANAHGMQLVNRALTIDPNHLYASYVKCGLLIQQLQSADPEAMNAAIAAVEVLLRLNPNFAPSHLHASQIAIAAGRYQQAEDEIQRAMTLSPKDPGIGLWNVVAGYALYAKAEPQKAIDESLQGIDAGFRAWHVYLLLAAAYSDLGRRGDATHAIDEQSRPLSQLGKSQLRLRHRCTRSYGWRAQGGPAGAMSETRTLTTLLAADVGSYSRLTSAADEEGTVSRLRALRQELIDL